MKHQESTTNNLYLPEMEHDACGIGAVVSIDGEKSCLDMMSRASHPGSGCGAAPCR